MKRATTRRASPPKDPKPAEAAEALKLPMLGRDLEEDAELLVREDGKTGGISFSLSSEAPVERFFGTEILSHDAGAIRLKRAKRGAMPLLFNHDWQDPVGMIENARVEEKRLVVDANFFNTERGQEVAQMVTDGLRNVSVGYRVYKFQVDTKTETATAIDWEPFEASIVSVPADPSVGVGRQLGGEMLECRMIRTADTAQGADFSKEPQMGKRTQGDAPAADQDAGRQDGNEDRIEVLEDNTDAVEREQVRAKSIASMARSFEITDRRTIQGWINSGKTIDSIADEMVKVRSERSKQAAIETAGIGLTDREAGRFSFVRAINAIVSKDWTKAGFEAEVSKATAAKSSRYLNELQFCVPPEVMYLSAHARTLLAGTAAAGGDLIATDLVSFIDILRNRSVALRAGVTVMAGLVGNVAIPKKSAAGDSAFIAETGTATADEMTLTQVTLSPKLLTGYEEYTKWLLMQSTPGIEGLVQADLAAGLGVKADYAVLWGSGSNNPTGIRFQTGIGTANPTAGTDVVYDDMLAFQQDLADGNALNAGATYLTTPGVARILMKKTLFGTVGDTPIWGGNMNDGVIGGAAGYPGMSSKQIASGCMLFGDYAQAIFAQWGGLEVEVNPYANFQASIIGVKASMFMDVAIRQAAAFSVGTGMTG